MFTLEIYDKDIHHKCWVELPETYTFAEQALAAANHLWDDDDRLVTKIRLKKTVTICTLVRPEEGED